MATTRYDAPIRSFTVEEVFQMSDTGILGEDEPVELLNGQLLYMSPQGPIHAALVTAIGHLLRDVVPPEYIIREEKPLYVDESNLPEPDLAVVKGPAQRYFDRHPAGHDCCLAVEIAVTSQELDRDKAAAYASSSVPEYWLLDVSARQLELHRSPTRDGVYQHIELLDSNSSVELGAFGVVVDVSSLLPPS